MDNLDEIPTRTLNRVKKKLERANSALTVQAAELSGSDEEVQARYQELQILQEISRIILDSRDLKAMMQRILDKTFEIGKFEIGLIRLLDAKGETLEPVASRGYRDPGNVAMQHKRTGDPSTARVITEVMATKEIKVENLSNTERMRSFKREGVHSIISVPLRTYREVLGVLQLGSRSGRDFRESELRILNAICGQAGIAVQKARLFGETEARYRELQTLHAISETILGSLDLKFIMQQILDKTFEIGGFDIGVVRVLDHAREALEPVASRGYCDPENVRRHRHTLEGYTTGAGTARVMEDKAAHVIDVTQTQGNRTLKSEGVHTLVVIPLRSHEDVLGVVQLGSRTQREFRESELRFLEAIGRQAGIAIQKIRLYEESQRAQAALTEKAQELARSNTELQNFAYIASHDLQEPLRMVASFVQLLAQRYKGKLDSEVDEFIAFAADGATRMQALINALLAYSRIGTKIKPLEQTDCEKLLGITMKNLQLAVEDSRAVITHDPLPTVMGDPTQLGQLFQNLIGNAIKFRGDKPPVIHICAARDGKEWYFSFRDNGIGIERQFFERIFVIFQRLHNKEKYPGTGIGLALCKKIGERHRGRIWVESEPGKGTDFRFTIPA